MVDQAEILPIMSDTFLGVCATTRAKTQNQVVEIALHEAANDQDGAILHPSLSQCLLLVQGQLKEPKVWVNFYHAYNRSLRNSCKI